MGEVDYAPGEPKGTPWHPHRGFETVTYIIDGIFEHQDSNGGGGVITNGDTQWMTAGAGILHIETPPEHLVVSGGLFHGFQLWVNLPAEQKWNPPRYQDPGARGEAADVAGRRRWCASSRARSRGSRARRDVHADHAAHATLSPGAPRAAVAADFNALVYVLRVAARWS
jgi:redox-sensitive bicupin YhaK (pirin superfamily)